MAKLLRISLSLALGSALLAGRPAAAAVDLSTAGSFKSIAAYRQLRQVNLFPRSQQPVSEQRLRLQGDLQWNAVLLEVAHEVAFFYQSQNDPRFALPETPRYGLRGDWRAIDTGNAKLFHRLDRAFGQVALGDIEVTVGRQVLPGGVGQIFSASGQTPRFDFVTVDPEYQLAQDAAMVAWNGTTRWEAVVLAKGEGQRRTNFHARMKTNLAGYDTAVRVGQADDKPFVGIDVAGNLGDSVLRGELAAYSWQRRAVFQALLGLEKVLDAKWSTRAELFYNGFGATAPYDLSPHPHRFAPYRGQWYAGLGVSWEMASRWKASGLAVANVLDPSTLLHASVSYNWGENVDLTAGQYLSVGGGNAEFGGRQAMPGAPQLQLGVPDLTYAELKVSF